MPAEAVDRAVARRIVETVNREHAGLALAAQDEIADAAALAAAARAKQLEGLRYEAERARRRFFAADPEHRLVAAPLEAEWNARLSALESATREHERLQRRDSAALSDQARQRVAGIEQDFAALWDAPSTGHADRKRMLALLVEDATLDRDGYQATARVRSPQGVRGRPGRLGPAARHLHRRRGRRRSEPPGPVELERRAVPRPTRARHPPLLSLALAGTAARRPRLRDR
jgi:hypothetical protein